MAIKGAKTIAEYAIRKWLESQNFAMECFKLSMDGNNGVLTDNNGDTLILAYDNGTRSVYEKED